MSLTRGTQHSGKCSTPTSSHQLSKQLPQLSKQQHPQFQLYKQLPQLVWTVLLTVQTATPSRPATRGSEGTPAAGTSGASSCNAPPCNASTWVCSIRNARPVRGRTPNAAPEMQPLNDLLQCVPLQRSITQCNTSITSPLPQRIHTVPHVQAAQMY